jgi:hypothetical protein
MREEDPAVAQIVAHFHGGERYAAKSRIFQIAQEHLRQLA